MKWEGYGDKDNTWESYEDVKHLDAFEDYNSMYPVDDPEANELSGARGRKSARRAVSSELLNTVRDTASGTISKKEARDINRKLSEWLKDKKKYVRQRQLNNWSTTLPSTTRAEDKLWHAALMELSERSGVPLDCMPPCVVVPSPTA